MKVCDFARSLEATATILCSMSSTSRVFGSISRSDEKAPTMKPVLRANVSVPEVDRCSRGGPVGPSAFPDPVSASSNLPDQPPSALIWPLVGEHVLRLSLR